MQGKNDEGVGMLETELLRTQEVSQLRTISSIFALLSYLQNEPLCGNCTSFATVFEKSMKKFLLIEQGMGKNRGIPEETRKLFLHIYNVLSDLHMPDNPVWQKKEGNCGFPPGVCLAKNAFTILEQIEGQP